MKKRTTLIAAAIVVATAVTMAASASRGTLLTGPASPSRQPTFQGYYDGHKDAYLITDVSNKAQAASLHANYSAALARVKGAPDQYFVQGRAAPGQLTVFDTEPGEKTYNPLWDELFVVWKAGVTPVLLVKDDQITELQKAGKLMVKDPHIVLNAPIVKVGKGS